MKNEQGFSLIIVIMTAAFIGIIITAAIIATNTFRLQNQQAKKQLEKKVEQFNADRK